MKKLSAFIMAATLTGVFELAAAKSDQDMVTGKRVFGSTAKNIATTDTIPKKSPNPTPVPSPNPPNPNPAPTPPTSPSPTSPTSPTTPPKS